MKPTILPVCSNGRPWTKIGVATNEDQARRVIKKHLGDHSKSLIENYGFELQVWKRTPLALELNGGLRRGPGPYARLLSMGGDEA